jgi:hypothetical protein
MVEKFNATSHMIEEIVRNLLVNRHHILVILDFIIFWQPTLSKYWHHALSQKKSVQLFRGYWTSLKDLMSWSVSK